MQDLDGLACDTILCWNIWVHQVVQLGLHVLGTFGTRRSEARPRPPHFTP